MNVIYFTCLAKCHWNLLSDIGKIVVPKCLLIDRKMFDGNFEEGDDRWANVFWGSRYHNNYYKIRWILNYLHSFTQWWRNLNTHRGQSFNTNNQKYDVEAYQTYLYTPCPWHLRMPVLANFSNFMHLVKAVWFWETWPWKDCFFVGILAITLIWKKTEIHDSHLSRIDTQTLKHKRETS